MTDTLSCPECSATLPAGAAFCTSCGTRTAAEAPAAPPAPPAAPQDATRVDNTGLQDTTQVFAPPPPAAAPPTYAPPAPWQPDGTAAAPAPPAAPAWTVPPPAPGAPQTPAWPQPSQAPPTQGWADAPPAAQWGAPAPAPVPATGRSPLGGLTALVGGVLTLVSLFTTWFGTNTGLSTTGWNLVSGWPIADGLKLESKDPYALLALGIVALVVAATLLTGKARGLVRVAAVVVGIAVIAVLVRDWLSVVDLVEPRAASSLEVSQKFGYFLGIAGGVVTIVAALLPAKKSA